MNHIFQILSYCIPAILVGIIAFYFFAMHLKEEENRRKFLLLKENEKNALPLRLQAYERLTLFLDRISPQKLVLRVPPLSKDKSAYELLLIEHINTEFDHNITQQIYISEDLWNVIRASKNATILIIKKIATDEQILDTEQMRTAILTEFLNKETPSNNAISHLVNEVTQVFRY
ncbi:MAG: hypothetical protein Q3983_09275 [Capnocytophaga sp.]|nr:hypothetical protein [Capnocytophaga sp.]